ncbi:MAG TPA: DUF5668 domain-containing protein [Terriglobales bacterium]
MAHFRSNPSCGCARCRLRGLMAPAVLVTLGILVLLGNLDVMDFHKSFPILLIVIGVIMVLQRTSSTEGHIPYGYTQPPTVPPPDAGGSYPPPTPGSGTEEVHNG